MLPIILKNEKLSFKLPFFKNKDPPTLEATFEI